MPEIEFIGLLAAGELPEGFQNFFKEYFTTQVIKKWDTNSAHAFQSILTVIAQYILPAYDRINMKLNELHGYSQWTRKYGQFLDSKSVDVCLNSAHLFIQRVLEFDKTLSTLATSFQAFITWITKGNNKRR
ncbi:anaphase-promoting complex subunit 4 long domain-containing protein [Pilobolus umbonatus]|nr:anaphase-promoting complex subunit 4 long domain-containing protein [Pilobolus umbonatus]